MAFGVEIKPVKIPDTISKGVARKIFAAEMIPAVNIGITELVTRLKIRTIKATSAASRAWKRRVARINAWGNVVGSVFTAAVHAIVLEKGARRHRPPIEPLEDWVRRKHGVEFYVGKGDKRREADIGDEDDLRKVAEGIQNGIAARGLPSTPNIPKLGEFERTAENYRPRFNRITAEAMERYRRRIESGDPGGAVGGA